MVFGLWAVVLLVVTTAYRGMGTSEALRQRHRQLHGSPVRGGDHGAGLDAPDRRLRRSGAADASRAPGGGTPAAWWMTILTIGPLLGSFITEPAAMTICALLLAPSVLRPAAEHAPQIRDARAAVRQRLDRRNADPFRGAAGPHGGAAVGMGHGVHAHALRLARGDRDRGLDGHLLPAVQTRAAGDWPHSPLSPTSSSPMTRPAPTRCCRFRAG